MQNVFLDVEFLLQMFQLHPGTVKYVALVLCINVYASRRDTHCWEDEEERGKKTSSVVLAPPPLPLSLLPSSQPHLSDRPDNVIRSVWSVHNG